MTSPVEILKSHAIDHFFTADEGRFVECTCTERVFVSEHPGHVAAALEAARPKPSVDDVETIALAWMRHQGYTEAKIEKAINATHQNSGCEAEGYDWLCHDENGKDNHPEWNDLSVAAEMANVALEALEVARREAYEVTEECGVERDSVHGGRTISPYPSYVRAEDAALNLKDWGMHPRLVHREILYGPWRPSASEEGR